ncbi:MAG: CDP-glycerol glycerophosphotransferase family protein [Brevibacterium sp.]
MTKIPESLTRRAKQGLDLGAKAAGRGRRLGGNILDEARYSSDFAPQDSDEFVAAAYFAADLDSVYQLEQWLWPMEQLRDRLREQGYGDQPFGILSRNIRSARRLREQTDIPVRFSRRSAGFDTFMSATSLRLVFYVNQALLNFQAMKFPRPAHVHLSHGESEKISMISNQLKAYDYIFTAGQAARERIGRTLVGLDPERMVDVGRPQLDRPRAVPLVWQNFDASAPSGPTVFYAPTWEGDSPSMAYGTLAHNGETFVRDMLSAGHRVIFRPHPRTGFLDANFVKARETVEGILAADPRGFIDSTPDVSWQLDAADACLAEMSSVAFDWLSARRPLVMIAPHNPGAEVLAGGLFDRCPVVELGREDELVNLLQNGGESTASPARLSNHYLGATDQDAQIGRFVSAGCGVINDRGTELDARTTL